MNLNQVTIPSKDLSNSLRFYKTLGLRLIVDAMPRYVRFECPDGDSTFSIHLSNNISINGPTLYFEVNNVTDTYNTLIKQGIYFETNPTKESWLWEEVKLKDPDGHTIIIYNAEENRKNPPWRIN